MTNLNNLNLEKSTNQTSKSSKFVENTKKAVRNVLTKTGIGINSMMPMATTTTPTIVPTSVNTITTIAPTASTAISTISLGAAAGLLTACSGGGEDGPNESGDTKDTIAPTINVSQSTIDVTGGKQIRIDGNQLYIGDILVASRNDNKTTACKVTLSLNGKPISSGTTINEGGTLNIKVSDTSGNSKNIDIKLTVQQDVSGLESLKNLNMQVDQEINLLNGITFGNGAQLVKTEIELDGKKSEILDPNHYTPAYPGTCSIILSVKDKNGEIKEYRIDNLTIKPLEYKAIEISNIKPEEILPIIGQVEDGDKQVYEHIEHLRLAEATRIRDMMREYGAGNHNAEEYQKLMSRLNTGMMEEYPLGYNNFEILGGGEFGDQGIEHSHIEWSILNSLLNHTNLKVIFSCPKGKRRNKMETFIKENPQSLLIFGCSACREDDTQEEFNKEQENNKVRELCKSKKLIIFKSGGNIVTKNGVLKNKSYHRYINGDNHGIYSLQANANGKSDSNADIALLVTVGTDRNGNIDQTNEETASSMFPVGFHDKSLFAGRAFPYHSSISGKIQAEGDINNGKYATSFTNYVNVAMMDLCFQMFAEAKDVDELLDMVKSTCLTDYIRFDGESQELQLINPAGFFKKYLMPINLPTNVKSGENIQLNKGYYKGIIFDIPGAEVKINGQWIAYNDANRSQIKNQNPMKLEWRLNGDLCTKIGYKGKNIEGKIIVVDDKRNGLNIDNKFSVSVQ